MKATVVTLLLALVLGTACANVTLASPLSLHYNLSTGQSVQDSLVVRNTGSTEVVVSVYQTDYYFQADGSNGYPQPGTLERSNATWLSLDSSTVVVPPFGRAEVSFTLRAPEVELSGTYWSVIMLEEKRAEASPTEGVAINTVTRYAVQIVTDLGTAEAGLNFASPSLSRTTDGSYVFQVDAHNTGEVMLRGEYYLELFGNSGELVARADGRSKRTYPGTSIRQQFAIGKLENGTYTAIVVGDFGGSRLFGAQYRLEVDDQ